MRATQDSRETFVQCLTTVRVSHDSHMTIARVSHNVRASFIFSKWSYLCRSLSHLYHIFVVLCRWQKLNCDVYVNICEGLALGSRHMR